MALSEATLDRLQKLFLPDDRDAAAQLLESQDPDDIAANAEAMERIRIAALKVSGGDLDRLVEALILAETDWRDLLVVAGFATDTKAHLRWRPAERATPGEES